MKQKTNKQGKSGMKQKSLRQIVLEGFKKQEERWKRQEQFNKHQEKFNKIVVEQFKKHKWIE